MNQAPRGLEAVLPYAAVPPSPIQKGFELTVAGVSALCVAKGIGQGLKPPHTVNQKLVAIGVAGLAVAIIAEETRAWYGMHKLHKFVGGQEARLDHGRNI